MEKRLSRFIKNRRSRLSEPLHELTPPATATSLSSPSPKRPSFFAAQIRAQLTSPDFNEPDSGSDALRSFAYDSCAVGKPPTFVTKAQPGNGPVKLQASRRLSTGELIATTQEGALKDIRDGEYVVGRKERPASRHHQRQSTRTPSVATYGQSTPTSPTSISLASPRIQSNIPNIERNQSLPSILGDYPLPDVTDDALGLGLIASAPIGYPRSSRGSATELRASISRPFGSRESLTSQRSSSTQDVNATLAALKKAEYSRLTGLYGPEAATLAFTRMSSSPSSPQLLQNLSPTISEPLPTLDPEAKEHSSIRASGLSGTSGSLYEESMGTSSPQRTSYVSSHADSSSATGPTSFTDEEYTATREDIKSMVEQIRSTYLDAFDTHGSPPQRNKSRRKKKKSKSSSSSMVGGLERTRPGVPTGRQTWHPENKLPEISTKRRVHSQPVAPVSRLPPIPASPTREHENDVGVKRADSTTLGEIMANMTRAHMKAQPKSKQPNEPLKQNFSRPITPTAKSHRAKESWLSLDSDATESPMKDFCRDKPKHLVHSRAISGASSTYTTTGSVSNGQRDDFEELYQDLFGKDAGSLWSSSSLFSENGSSLLITHSGKGTPHSSQYSTPRKPPRITSIPESPEYTHLADPRCPGGNFI